MKLIFTEPFKRDYADLPKNARTIFDKALGFFVNNPHHPSLRAKKLPGTEIWYARIPRAYRFTFQLVGELVILRRVGTHAVLTKERKQS